MSDNFIPKKFYLLQVYDKHDNTWRNGYSNSHVDGFYLDKKTAHRAATSYLGERRNCRIIEFSESTMQIDLLDSSKTMNRKIKRYLNSELKFIKKYKDYDTDLASFSFLDLSKIKTSNHEVRNLLKTAKKNHVNYGILLKLKCISGVNTCEHLFSRLILTKTSIICTIICGRKCCTIIAIINIKTKKNNYLIS